MTPDRREWLIGAATMALAAAAPARAAAGELVYDYAFLDLALKPGSPPRGLLASYLREMAPRVAAAGGQVVGGFSPQLGWHTRQAAVLAAWPKGAAPAAGAADAAFASPLALSAQRTRLHATARPLAGQALSQKGIYTHRWFVTETRNVAEVVELSVAAWKDFEGGFDTDVFGLFQADPTPEEAQRGVNRMLLMTGYRDHSVWEASREPNAAAKAAFARRQQLTLDSWVASCLPMAPPT